MFDKLMPNNSMRYLNFCMMTTIKIQEGNFDQKCFFDYY